MKKIAIYGALAAMLLAGIILCEMVMQFGSVFFLADAALIAVLVRYAKKRKRSRAESWPLLRWLYCWWCSHSGPSMRFMAIPLPKTLQRKLCRNIWKWNIPERRFISNPCPTICLPGPMKHGLPEKTAVSMSAGGMGGSCMIPLEK